MTNISHKFSNKKRLFDLRTILYIEKLHSTSTEAFGANLNVIISLIVFANYTIIKGSPANVFAISLALKLQ